ncbi:MAG TPA: hypothetical protein VF132_08055 [Rudaea sp.]
MKDKIVESIACLLAMSRIRRRFAAVKAIVRTVPATYRFHLRQWVDAEWAAVQTQPRTASSHVELVLWLDKLSQDPRLGSESQHVRLRSTAAWLAAVTHATAGATNEGVAGLHRSAIVLLREIRQSPAATDPDAWFHVESRRA